MNNDNMNPRQQRGHQIFKKKGDKITEHVKGTGWYVPSQSSTISKHLSMILFFNKTAEEVHLAVYFPQL